MKPRHVAALALALITHPLSVDATHCELDTLSYVSESGAILETTASGKYRVNPTEHAKSAIWNVGEDVIVCSVSGHYIIIHEDDGQAVDVSRLD
jgi:hypothetical protein